MGRKNIDDELESQLPLIISMVKDGCTDKEIVEKLNISPSTWKRKKALNKNIKEALGELLDNRNQEVEESLFKCCNGYKYYEEVISKVKTETLASDGITILSNEEVIISNVKKYKGPELAAQKYWLNNKKKVVWQDEPHKVANDKKLTNIKEKELNEKIKEI